MYPHSRRALVSALIAALILTAPAGAASSAQNGKIAFEELACIRIAEAGGGSTCLTPGYNPSWSPDGTKIAFDDFSATGNRQIFTANADGTGRCSLRIHVGTKTPAGPLTARRSPSSRNATTSTTRSTS